MKSLRKIGSKIQLVTRQFKTLSGNNGIYNRDENVVVVVVLGPTGSGKSSLIKTVSGISNIVVGHGLDSCKNAYSPIL